MQNYENYGQMWVHIRNNLRCFLLHMFILILLTGGGFGSPIMLASVIANTIKSRTDAMLKKTKTAVSSKPIVMRAEYSHCPNLTVIDTPGFILKVKDTNICFCR